LLTFKSLDQDLQVAKEQLKKEHETNEKIKMQLQNEVDNLNNLHAGYKALQTKFESAEA
jgi:hypothetical protein